MMALFAYKKQGEICQGIKSAAMSRRHCALGEETEVTGRYRFETDLVLLILPEMKYLRMWELVLYL
jgi:hypothetical protein